MNIRYILYLCSRVLFIPALLLLLPLFVSFYYHDGCFLAFIVPICLMLSIGILFGRKKPAKSTLFAKEGFAVVSLIWILISPTSWGLGVARGALSTSRMVAGRLTSFLGSSVHFSLQALCHPGAR